MKNPNIKTEVVHSKSKAAWNIVCRQFGRKYKVATVPYATLGNEHVGIEEVHRQEAFEHAVFISTCFNQSDVICGALESPTTIN